METFKWSIALSQYIGALIYLVYRSMIILAKHSHLVHEKPLTQALSGQYFCTRIFLLTLPIALRSMLSTTFKTVGILYGAISFLSSARRVGRSNGGDWKSVSDVQQS